MEVPGTPNGAYFFKFELKPNGKDSAMSDIEEKSSKWQAVNEVSRVC